MITLYDASLAVSWSVCEAWNVCEELDWLPEIDGVYTLEVLEKLELWFEYVYGYGLPGTNGKVS